MADTPIRRGSPVEFYELSRCCPEAQADGAPCPTLGRDCAVCQRATLVDVRGGTAEAVPIRPVGND